MFIFREFLLECFKVFGVQFLAFFNQFRFVLYFLLLIVLFWDLELHSLRLRFFIKYTVELDDYL